jgi:hypothetical protein
MAMNKYQKQAAADYRAGVLGDRGGKIEVIGLKEAQKALRTLSKESRDNMKQTHREAGQIIVEAATPLVPRESGTLLTSIKSAPLQRQGRVRIGSAAIPYAGPIHFGWPARKIRPNPFIYEVLDGKREEVKRLYLERINQLIKNNDLD